MTNQEQEIEQTALKIHEAMKGELPGVFNPDYWQGKLMDYVLKDPDFKVDMFRFVDVLPSLSRSEQVAQHIQEYLLKPDRSLPVIIGAALKAATFGMTAGLAANTIRKNVTDMAERFIIGKNASEAAPHLKALHQDGIAFTVDLLGEATVSEQEAANYQQQYLSLITELAQEVTKWKPDEVIDRNHHGSIPRANVSIKVSSLDSELMVTDPAGAVARLKKKLLPLFVAAKENNVFLNLDLEQWAMHGITYDLFEELVTTPELRSWPHFGVVVQAYLKEAETDVKRLLSLARSRSASITVRLVKGAYWDYEVVNAIQHGFECPVLTEKTATDAQYERLSQLLLSNSDYLYAAFGSHNLRSLATAMTLAKENSLPQNAFEIQMLYGMAEPERKVLRSMGHRVRVYAPIGEMLPGMAYLVRRLLENTSNSGFLRLSHHNSADFKNLVKKPEPANVEQQVQLDFKNCPELDFTKQNVRKQFKETIDGCLKQIPVTVSVVIGEQRISDRKRQDHLCPSQSSLVATSFACATREDGEKAVQIAYEAFPAWRNTALEDRAQLLERLADRLEKDRYALAALQCVEVGKPWREADADVCEAVDFCRYYAWQAKEQLAPRKQGQVLGEGNVLLYEGRGPTVVIAPWNFPLAILCGMTTAALVSGNTVLMKPAEQSTAIAYALYQRMIEVGFPQKVVQFLPGAGEEIGAFLVDHPLVAQIAFTGSKEVGLHILQRAAQVQQRQPELKRVVCEMGGKNAIIVDEDADLDESIAGIIHSAFGYAGQKCSACSRLLVVGDIYESFVKRLTEACHSLTTLPSYDPACHLGPVIDPSSFERLKTEILQAKGSARPLFVGEWKDGGFFVPPAIFEVQDASHRLMQAELFGPVLAVLRVKDFDEAIKVATATEFALTGAVFSRSPSNLEKARKQFRVGNLYLNRGSTGAYVHRQPFGGFHMSGLGTKAGGPDYLKNFVNPRVVTENTMRRGFTPDLEV